MTVPMQVVCPHCEARYEFDRSAIPAAGYDAQCTNCEQVFFVTPDEGAATPVPLPSGTTPVPGAPPEGEQPTLEVSVACPRCHTVYQFSASDIPADGYEAECTHCQAAFSVPRAALFGEIGRGVGEPLVPSRTRTPEVSPARPELVPRAASAGPVLEPEPITDPDAKAAPRVSWAAEARPHAQTVETEPVPQAPARHRAKTPTEVPAVVFPSTPRRELALVRRSEPADVRSDAGDTSWGPPALRSSGHVRASDAGRRLSGASGDHRAPLPRGRSFDDVDESGELAQATAAAAALTRRGRLLRGAASLGVLLACVAVGAYVFAPSAAGPDGETRGAAPLEGMSFARAAFERDTDQGYEEAARALALARVEDPSDPETLALDALTSAFRAVDAASRAKRLAEDSDRRLSELNEQLQGRQRDAALLEGLRKQIEALNGECVTLRDLADLELERAERVLTSARPPPQGETMIAAVRGIVASFTPSRMGVAQAELAKAATADRDTPAAAAFAAYLRGRLAADKGDLVTARRAYEEVARLSPRWRRPRYDLALVLEGMGERAAARHLLAEVVHDSPDHARARELLAAIDGRGDAKRDP